MRYKSTFIVAVLMMCASFAVVHADVKYTIVTKYTFAKTSSHPADAAEETNTSFVAPEKLRREMVQGDDIYMSKEVLIFRCDLHQEFRLDDSLKIYTVSKLSSFDYSSPASASELKEDIPQMTTITNYAIKKLAAEKINGFDTQGYEVTTTTEYSGDFANREEKSTMKWWVADVPSWQSCIDFKGKTPASFTHVVTLPERRRYTEESTGDVEKMDELRTQFPVRIEGAIDNLPSTSSKATIDQNLTSLSRDKLDDSLFEIPEGYRKVSSDEYQKLRLKAELDAIQKAKKAKAHQ